MAKTFIVLLFAALFVFSSAAHSLRRPETVQFSDDFPDDFFAGFGGGGRPSFGGGRPSFSAPRPSFSAPRPSMNIARPPVNIARPPVNIARPPVNIARPPVNIPRPPVNIARPPVNIPRPPVNIPKPPVNIARPPVNIARPPVNIPKPTPVVAKPAPVIAKPAPVIAKPTPVVAKPTPVVAKPTPVVAKPTPINTPKPTPTVTPPKTTTPVTPAKTTVPVTPQKPVTTVPTPAKTNPTSAPSTQIKTSVSVNNGQIAGQAGITKTSGPNTVSAQATYDQGKLGAQGTYTRTIQGGHIEAGGKVGGGAKPEIHVGGSKTIGANTVAGQVGVADGKLGAQGTLTRTIQGGHIEAGGKVGGGAKPEFYVGGSKTVGADSITGKVGVADGKVSAQGTYTRTTDVGQVSVGGKIGDGKPELKLGLAKDLRGGAQGTLNLNVKEGGVGGSVGYNSPIGKTGTLSTEVGYSQDKGAYGQITAKIPF